MNAPEVVMQRIADGDKTAEQELINHFWRPLYYIILRQCGDATLAQDIVQDAMLIIIEKARTERIENPDAIAAFVKRVGENVLIAHYRKERRRQTDTSDDIPYSFPDSQSELASRISQQQLVDIVAQVMNELSVERDRDLLRSYFLHGRNKQQVCEDLDLSAEHFDRVLHRAKQRLKQALAVKCEVDLSTDSLATLLSAAFVAFSMNFNSPSMENFLLQVREAESAVHYNGESTADVGGNLLPSDPVRESR